MIYAALSFLALGSAPASSGPDGSTCHDIKSAYQSSSCCSSNLAQTTTYHVSPPPPAMRASGAPNPCAGAKPYHADPTANGGAGDNYFSNVNCTIDGVIQVLEQAGANVTLGYTGDMDTGGRTPITTPYFEAGLCPVNVHWHLGAEHLSVGEYDEAGTGPTPAARRLGDGSVRLGHQCHHYDAADPKFTTPYQWKHCTQMEVGQTYEVHWPHSAAGACGTVNQYQTPFYDGKRASPLPFYSQRSRTPCPTRTLTSNPSLPSIPQVSSAPRASSRSRPSTPTRRSASRARSTPSSTTSTTTTRTSCVA